jgi:hypothetical protein
LEGMDAKGNLFIADAGTKVVRHVAAQDLR